MSRRSFRLLGLAAAALPALLAAARPQGACHRVHLSPPLGWVSSAVYVPALDRLLIVHSLAHQLLLVSRDGATVPLANATARRAEEPLLLAVSGDGFLLLDRTLLVLDRDLNLRSTQAGGSSPSPHQPALGLIRQWTAAANDIVAYGALSSRTAPRRSVWGFLRLPISRGRPTMLKPFPACDLYGLGYDDLASLGTTAYFLALSDTAELYRVKPGAARPAPLPHAVPERFRVLPSFAAPIKGPSDAQRFFAQLESATMPAGLYAGSGFLFLLTRQPLPGGLTDWRLHRLAGDGRALGFGTLRTSAHHLTAVPSADTWFFFERGAVTEDGSQTIGSILEVPAARLSALTPAGGDLCPELNPPHS